MHPLLLSQPMQSRSPRMIPLLSVANLIPVPMPQLPTCWFIYLHKYQPYTTWFKCPVKLTGAVGTTNIHPLGEGFLHLPAPTPCGFLAVWCFYSPHLSSTLISPCDILKTSKDWRTGFSGQDMKTYFGAKCDQNFGRCTFTCHINCRWSHNISINGIVMNGNCYTYPLILPDVSLESPLATWLNCLDYALIF